MNRPLVAARLREGALAQSPIREIMKLADRKNIIGLGLDPELVISFAGGWVNHRAPEPLRAQYQWIADDPNLFHELGAYAPTRGLPELREALADAGGLRLIAVPVDRDANVKRFRELTAIAIAAAREQ